MKLYRAQFIESVWKLIIHAADILDESIQYTAYHKIYRIQ